MLGNFVTEDCKKFKSSFIGFCVRSHVHFYKILVKLNKLIILCLCLQVYGCSQFYGDFVVDNMGWALVNWDPNSTDGWVVPVYPFIDN